MGERFLIDVYKDDFIKTQSQNNIYIVNDIVNYVNKIGKDLHSWSKDELRKFIKDKSIESLARVSNYTNVVREFSKYILTNEKIDLAINEMANLKLNHGDPIECVDIEKLLSITIDNKQYEQIRSQITSCARDRVIFELSWLGLKSSEIESIKKDDLEFGNDNGRDYVIITITEDKIFRVDDSELVKDLKECLEEKFRIIMRSNGKQLKQEFKASKYLIKPLNAGRRNELNDNKLQIVVTTLKKCFENLNISCNGINMSRLTPESIRRSKLIFLLSPNMRDKFDVYTVSMIFGLQTVQNLKWYQKVADLKYKSRVEVRN